MRTSSCFRTAACCLVLLLANRPALATSYTWASAVSGSIDDASKWSPVGVPGAPDRLNFGLGGTYTVTFPGTVPQTNFISQNLGLLTFTPTSPHTTGGFRIGSGGAFSSLTQNGGVFFADYMQCGAASGFTTLILTNRAQFQSKGVNNPDGSVGDHLGYEGTSDIYVQSGARYYSNKLDGSHGALELGSVSGSSVTMSVFGLATLPTAFSGLVTTGGGDMIVGAAGAGNLVAYNGGFIDVSGHLTMARDLGSFGFVSVGPSSIGTPFLRTAGNLWIGRNSGGAAGHAELLIRNNSWASVAGTCEIGDPDNDAQSVLRVQEGGRFYADLGLIVYPTTGKGLDLQGGTTHVRAGQFFWPGNKYLYISSTSGNPKLKISNGLTNFGPDVPAFNSQLFVARSGNGTLRLTKAGTVFQCGAGATTVADSVDGLGFIEVDSVATFRSEGPINIGVRGSGYVTVSNGSLMDVGTAAVALTNTAYAFVNIVNPGTALWVRDNFWIGGGFGGPGGNGDVTVDSLASIEVFHTGISPSLLTIYSPGSLAVRYGGSLHVWEGTISNAGQFIIADGDVEAATLSQPPTGLLKGWGRIKAGILTSAKIDPFDATDGFGGIHVTGSFQQFGAGHLAMDLNTAGGKQCDTLFVSGAVALAGALDLKTAPGFVPTPGDIFTILSCGSRSGTFDAVTWNGNPLTSEATIVYEPNYVHVIIGSVTSGVEPGMGLPEVSHEASLAAIGGVRSQLGFVLALSGESSVKVQVFDVRGRQMATLVDGALTAGRHELVNPAEVSLPSGTYFARAVVQANGKTMVKTARGVVVR